MVDPRFSQLLQLAKDGDEASVAQLWHEFGFDFHAECPPVDSVSSVSSVVNSPSDSLGCSSSAAGGENSPDSLLTSDLYPLTSGNAEGGAQC